MKVAIASDHAGFELKAELVRYLRKAGHDVLDLGSETSKSVDYPDFGYKLARVISRRTADMGVAICGSGIGISIAVNRHRDCRCALVSDGLSARLAREHNDANVVALGARLIGSETAKDCVSLFLATPFGGDRHARRVGKLGTPMFEEPA